jgi:hypothetical protein
MVPPLPEVLTINVRPAVLKYLRRKLHLAEGQPFRLTKKCKVGRFLYHTLRNPQQDRQYSAAVATYPGRFVVHISQQLSWLNGCRHLTDQGVHDFNRHVEDLMEEEFITTVQALADHGIQFETKKVALRFMQSYDLTEDDLTLDALIKAYYRFRKAQYQAAQRLLHIPNCPAPQRLQVAA